MAEKKPSLTVLGGALAGTRFVLEGLGPEAFLGADPSCQFQLALFGVSPQHARLRFDGQSYTIEDAGSEQGLHVNDGRVIEATRLRNGDIVWLGTPGEADVVMLQCILPARAPAQAKAPPARAPSPGLSEDETLALALEQSEGAVARAEVSESEPATAYYTAEEAAVAAEAPFGMDAAAAAPFASDAPEMVEELPAEEEAPVEAGSVPFVVDAPPDAPPPPSVPFEDDTREQAYVFEEESSTVVIAGEDTMAPTPTDPAEVEEAPTFVMPEPEPTVAFPPPEAHPNEELAQTEFIARSTLAPPAAAPPPPSSSAASVPAPAPVASPPAPRPPRPPPPASSPAASIPGRRVTPRPPAREEGEEEAFPAPRRSAPPVGLYAGIGVAVLALVGVGVLATRKLKGGPPPTTISEALPATVAAAPPPTAPPPSLAADLVPVEIQPEVSLAPAPVPSPAAVATPPPTPSTTLRAAPSPLPTPAAAAKKSAPTPAATPAGPSPEQLRAQQVAGLLGQAENALAAAQYDRAIGHFDEVLKLDPGNSRATADRASAVSLRDTARKTFVAGRTVVKTEKAGKGSIAGFEGADVQRTPDFSGRIEFEMSPASGLKPGDAWTLKFYLVNDGKKAIKVGGVTANTVVNGAGSGGAITPGAKEIAPQQRVLVGQLAGSWRDGTSSWSADVLVTANKGDSLKGTISWR